MTAATTAGELVVREPSSLVQVESTCVGIEEWAAACDSVPELRDAGNKLSAIDQYLAKTTKEGRSRVAAAQRRLEVRIGQLIGPAPDPSESRRSDLDPSSTNDGSDLTRNERHEFRRMADHEDVVEDAIANSTDDEPASRRKVSGAITNGAPKAAPPAPRRRPLPDALRDAGIDLNNAAEKVARLVSDDRFTANKDQVTPHLRGHLRNTVEVCQDLLDQLATDQG